MKTAKRDASISMASRQHGIMALGAAKSGMVAKSNKAAKAASKRQRAWHRKSAKNIKISKIKHQAHQ